MALIRCCDSLINAFTQVMIDIFSFPVNEIPLRFTKYFITIVNKTCSSKEIMKEVSCKEVNDLVEQLLCRLLIDNLDKIGSNKEGELILKNLNSSMLRMLENCNHSHIFVVLFGLLTKYKDSEEQPKIPSLIIKCLLKLSKNMEKLIEKIDLNKFLVSIHEYLVTIDSNKTQNDDLGTRIAKTLINEIVKLKKDAIWDNYNVIQNHPKPDMHLKKWIQIILKSLQLNNNGPRITVLNSVADVAGAAQQQPPQENKTQSRMYLEFEIKKIITDLKDRAKYKAAIARLDKFSKQNPVYDFNKNLNKEGATFAQQVLADLEKFRTGALNVSNNNTSNISQENTTGSMGGRQPQDLKSSQFARKMNAVNSSSNLMQGFNAQKTQQDLNNSQNRALAFKNKMSTLTKRQSVMYTSDAGPGGLANQLGSAPANSSLLGNAQPAQQNLNTSFSEMN